MWSTYFCIWGGPRERGALEGKASVNGSQARPPAATMARIRYQYPEKIPRAKRQRFLLGTRVANPLEGRTGHIQEFNSETGMYTLVFNDGHKEDVADADVDRFVIRAPPPSVVEEEKKNEDGGDDDADPQRILGAVVQKTVRSYEGEEEVVTGYVASYLPGIQRYRVVYEDTLLEEMTVEQAEKEVAKAKRKLEGMESSEDAQEEEMARKKHKNGVSESGDTPLHTHRFPSRSEAYTILRKILQSIMAQREVKQFSTEKQRTVLKNEEMKPKKALEFFVDADGLVLLRKVLELWIKKVETHAGVMMVLKILATLPGVTETAVTVSQIGRTLRHITKLDRTLVDAALVDLADWVIRTWRREARRNGMTSNARTKILQQTAVEKGTVLPALYVGATSVSQQLKKRQAMTEHLRQLMTAPDPNSPQADEEPGFFLPNYNSLGSKDKRRPLRQIMHIESLVERTRNKNESTKIKKKKKKTDENGNEIEGEEEEVEEEDKEQQEIDARRVIKFRARPEVLEYSTSIAPAAMQSTTRSKIIDERRQRSESMDENDKALDGVIPVGPPNRLAAPIKSILKLRDEVLLPYNKVIWY